VELEYDTTVELTCSEDECDELDAKSKKSGGTNKLLSEWTKSIKQESPELFRLKARLRMTSSSKKFCLGV